MTQAAPRRAFEAAENWVSVGALSVMSALPLVEVAARRLRTAGIPGSTVFVQHLTLWLALLGAALAARSGRLLSLATDAYLPERWRPALPESPRCCCAAAGTAK